MARSAVDTGPSTPPAEPAVPAQTWQEIYSGFSLGRVIDESRMLRAAIDEVSFSYYQDAYDRRQYEVIGFRNPGERFEIDGDEFDDLCSVTFFKDGTVARVVLPREQFPQAYEMQEKVRWLTARQDELERAPLTDLRLEARR